VGAGGSVARRGLVAESRVPPVVVVVVFPVADDNAGLGQRPEAVDVQAFVADPRAEGLT
jgi:methyl coenzyme M reductase subunit C